MRILVTGSAGFVGFHLARRLLADGHEVVGIDGLTPYYDVALKRARHALLAAWPGFSAHIQMLEDLDALAAVTQARPPQAIVHLAAQAGVRYSLEQPRAYIDANIIGAFNVLEVAKACDVRHLLMASTSSVYGANARLPYRENDRTDHVLTVYAATKKADEDLAHAYSHLWRLPTTMLRLFTVYGPWGRPDMALFRFVERILEGQPIDLFNGGDHARDFTYVEDVVEGIVRLLDRPPVAGVRVGGALDSLSPAAPWRTVNLGRGEPVALMAFVAELERVLGRKAQVNPLPAQPGDVATTFAETSLLHALTGYRPTTSLAEGVAAFCRWRQGEYAALMATEPAS